MIGRRTASALETQAGLAAAAADFVPVVVFLEDGTLIEDSDGDGVTDVWIDTERFSSTGWEAGDGLVGLTEAYEPEVRRDTNGDGEADHRYAGSYGYEVDSNDDGLIDRWFFVPQNTIFADLDFDGDFEIAIDARMLEMEDRDLDGFVDIWVDYGRHDIVDEDGDGKIDHVVHSGKLTEEDTNADGLIDLRVTEGGLTGIDEDGDGSYDVTYYNGRRVEADTDFDGVFETVTEEEASFALSDPPVVEGVVLQPDGSLTEDTNGDGMDDVWIEPQVFITADWEAGDGRPGVTVTVETYVNVDSNFDGMADLTYGHNFLTERDTNDDGLADKWEAVLTATIFADLDFDGTPETVIAQHGADAEDTDFDGIADVWVDHGESGIVDEDDDGRIDVWTYAGRTASFDTNGDGDPDLRYNEQANVEYDTDGDGSADLHLFYGPRVEEDRDFDGVFETVTEEPGSYISDFET